MAEVFVAPGVVITGQGQETLALLTAAAANMHPNIESITVFSGDRGQTNHNDQRGALDFQITSAITGQPVYSYSGQGTQNPFGVNQFGSTQNYAGSAAYYASAAMAISDTAKAMGIGPSSLGLGINWGGSSLANPNDNMHVQTKSGPNQGGYFNLASVSQMIPGLQQALTAFNAGQPLPHGKGMDLAKGAPVLGNPAYTKANSPEVLALIAAAGGGAASGVAAPGLGIDLPDGALPAGYSPDFAANPADAFPNAIDAGQFYGNSGIAQPAEIYSNIDYGALPDFTFGPPAPEGQAAFGFGAEQDIFDAATAANSGLMSGVSDVPVDFGIASRGDEGPTRDQTLAVQQTLQDLGYNVKADGAWGPQTAAAAQHAVANMVGSAGQAAAAKASDYASQNVFGALGAYPGLVGLAGIADTAGTLASGIGSGINGAVGTIASLADGPGFGNFFGGSGEPEFGIPLEGSVFAGQAPGFGTYGFEGYSDPFAAAPSYGEGGWAGLGSYGEPDFADFGGAPSVGYAETNAGQGGYYDEGQAPSIAPDFGMVNNFEVSSPVMSYAAETVGAPAGIYGGQAPDTAQAAQPNLMDPANVDNSFLSGLGIDLTGASPGAFFADPLAMASLNASIAGYTPTFSPTVASTAPAVSKSGGGGKPTASAFAPSYTGAAPAAASGGISGGAGFGGISPGFGGFMESIGITPGGYTPGVAIGADGLTLDPSGGSAFGYSIGTDENGNSVTVVDLGGGSGYGLPTDVPEGMSYGDFAVSEGLGSDDGGGGIGTVLCGYYRDIGWLSRRMWAADLKFSLKLPLTARLGYLWWACPTVVAMRKGGRKGRILQAVMWPIVKHWANYAAHREGVRLKRSFAGAAVHYTLAPLCWVIGRLVYRKGSRHADA